MVWVNSYSPKHLVRKELIEYTAVLAWGEWNTWETSEKVFVLPETNAEVINIVTFIDKIFISVFFYFPWQEDTTGSLLGTFLGDVSLKHRKHWCIAQVFRKLITQIRLFYTIWLHGIHLFLGDFPNIWLLESQVLGLALAHFLLCSHVFSRSCLFLVASLQTKPF